MPYWVRVLKTSEGEKLKVLHIWISPSHACSSKEAYKYCTSLIWLFVAYTWNSWYYELIVCSAVALRPASLSQTFYKGTFTRHVNIGAVCLFDTHLPDKPTCHPLTAPEEEETKLQLLIHNDCDARA